MKLICILLLSFFLDSAYRSEPKVPLTTLVRDMMMLDGPKGPIITSRKYWAAVYPTMETNLNLLLSKIDWSSK